MFAPSGLSETWTFGTSVREGRVGEFRDALGLRETHQLDWAIEAPERLRMELAFRRGLAAGGEFYVPVWPAASWMADPVTAGQFELEVEGASEYRVGDLVALISSDMDFELQVLVGIDGSVLEFGASPGLGARPGPFLVAPVATCLCPDGLTFGINFAVQTARAEFIRIDPGVEGFNPFGTFEGVPVLEQAPALGGSLVGGVARQVDLLESGLGAIAGEETQLYSRSRQTMALLNARADRYVPRGWVRFLRGRDRSFWMPSFLPEIPVVQSIGAVSFDTTNFAGIEDLAGKVILIRDGLLSVVRRISGTTMAGSLRRISYPSVGQALTPAAQVSLVQRVRVDTDEVQWQHEFIGGGLLSRADLPVREVVE